MNDLEILNGLFFLLIVGVAGYFAMEWWRTVHERRKREKDPHKPWPKPYDPPRPPGAIQMPVKCLEDILTRRLLLQELYVCLNHMVAYEGITHGIGCPEDDTCTCEWVNRVNAALRASEEVLQGASPPLREKTP